MLKMQESCREREAFITAYIHEVRGAINLLSGALCVLQGTELSGLQQKLTSRMKRASELLLSLSNDYLDLRKIQEGQTTLYPSFFQLSDLADDTESLFRDKVLCRGLDWECRRNYPKNLSLTADKTRLFQILSNLLQNACKFTDQGFIRLTIAYTEPRAIQTLLFKVEDSGIGMTPEETKNLFREYYQCENALTKGHVGTGLGLCISKNLANAMGGDLTVTSEKGKGSCFTLRLPLISQYLANPA